MNNVLEMINQIILSDMTDSHELSIDTQACFKKKMRVKEKNN